MKKLFFIFIIIAVAGLALVSCVHTDDPGQDEPVEDDFGTPGFTRDETTSSEMFDDFVGGLMQTMKYASSEVVPSLYKKIAVNLRLDLNFNGNESYILFRSGYDADRPQNTTLCIEVFSSATQDLLAGIYLFEKTSYLYVHLAENKIKIPLLPGTVSGIFPVDIGFDADASMLVSSGLKSFMYAAGKIDYEYKIYKPDKNNSFCERHFRFDVDMGKSLRQLAQMSSYWQEKLGLKNGEMDFIFQNILGITGADILAGRIPDSKITVEFSTQGGNPDYVGQGRLTKMKVSADIDQTNDGDSVFGKDFDIVFDAVQISISNSALQGLPGENAFADFVDYADRKFRFKTELKYDGEEEANDVTLDFIYDIRDGDKTTFSLSAVGKNTGSENCSVYYVNHYLYLNWTADGREYNIEGHFDFNQFVSELAELKKDEAKNGLISILSYILNCVRLQNGEIRYHFEPLFFADLIGLDDRMLLELFDRCSEEDVVALLTANQIAISDLNRPFTLVINTSKAFIEQISDITLPENPNRLG